MMNCLIFCLEMSLYPWRVILPHGVFFFLIKKFFLKFWPCQAACRILITQPRIKPVLPAVETQVRATGPPGKFPGRNLEKEILREKERPRRGRAWQKRKGFLTTQTSDNNTGSPGNPHTCSLCSHFHHCLFLPFWPRGMGTSQDDMCRNPTQDAELSQAPDYMAPAASAMLPGGGVQAWHLVRG